MTHVAAEPLRGQVAVVTGAAVGVGTAFARAFGLAGAHVTICDVRPDVHATADELRSEGCEITAHVADVASRADVSRVVDAVALAHDGIDILVNNAAIVRATPVSAGLDEALAHFDDVIAVNLRGAYMFGRAVIPEMIRRGGGNIVNVATDHIHTCGWPDAVDHRDAPECAWSSARRAPGAVGMDAYDASKWALNGLTQEWAKSLRRDGVRVNNLCLGSTDSHMQRSYLGYDDHDNPPPAELMATWMDPDAVARVVLELVLEGPRGRSGDNVGLWRAHPTVLPSPSAILNVPADFDPAQVRGSSGRPATR